MNYDMRKWHSAIALAGMLTVGQVVFGSQQDTQQPAPDNTKTNQQAAPTADQQKMNAADRELTKKIRAAIHEDKSCQRTRTT
jgi:glutathione synthase/RimK-type ligase-like ATP-grasp enzyme